MAASRGTAAKLPARLLLALAATLLVIAACGRGGKEGAPSGDPVRATNSPVSSASADDPAMRSDAATTDNQGSQANAMDIRITITINDQRFEATLIDSPAARDLSAQLPATIDMADHGGVEKTGRLALALSLDGQPEGADPDVGDVGYYAPGNDLVLYYGDQSYYPGIVVLGRLEGDAAARIAELDGSVTTVIESAVN